MATIYYWETAKLSVGHISMALSDGTYISHWPENNKGLKSTLSKPKQSLEEDSKAEGRDPDKCIIFFEKFFNSSKISTWWEDLIKGLRYNVVTSNCAHVVFEALTRLEFKYPKIADNYNAPTEFAIPNPLLKTPYRVFQCAEFIILKTNNMMSHLCNILLVTEC